MATLSAVFHHVGERFQAWRERERAMAELSGLDDRMLADIGLNRGDIPYILLEDPAELVATRGVLVGEPVNANSHDRCAA
jgi:uncharacterized protein YjiS (DUF1127 family)